MIMVIYDTDMSVKSYSVNLLKVWRFPDWPNWLGGLTHLSFTAGYTLTPTIQLFPGKSCQSETKCRTILEISSWEFIGGSLDFV